MKVSLDLRTVVQLAELTQRVLRLVWLLGLLGGAAVAAPALHLRVEAGEHTASIRRVAVSPDGERIATVGDDKTGRIWRTSDRRLLAVLRVPIGEGDVGRLYGVAFSPDGQQVAVAGTNGSALEPHRIDIFNAGNGTHLRTLPLDAGNVVRLLWVRSGRYLVACLAGRDGLRILDAASGVLTHAESFRAPCFGLTELADGSVWASGWDGTIRELRLEGERWRVLRALQTEIADPQAVAASPDGRHIAVGYRSRLPSGAAAVDVFDVSNLKLARRYLFHDLRGGSLGAVAWSGDGRTIVASGRADQGDGKHVLTRMGWPDGRTESRIVATDSVQDMGSLGPDRFVVASGAGSWGLVNSSGDLGVLGSSVVDMRGADHLRADEGLQTVSFGRAGGQGALRFSLPQRHLRHGDEGGLSSARRVSFGLSVTQWQDRFQPAIAGRPVSMDPLEISRAFALLPDGGGAVLGTTRTLRRFDAAGAQQWAVRVASEVRAVTAAGDGRLLLSAQLDGTLRWWRASDGALLLSLFVHPDGRWVIWNEQGYYDAGPGAESLVGWHLNRSDGVGVDFFTIGKFRDKYHRPDVIDGVLQTLDLPSALKQADSRRAEHVAAEQTAMPSRVPISVEPSSPSASPSASPVRLPSPAATPTSAPQPPPMPATSAPERVESPTPDPQTRVLPPVLVIYNERALSSDATRLRIAFSVRAGAAEVDAMLVRINGRPIDPTELVMPARQDGLALGHLVVSMPAERAEVSVMAQAGSLVSEPIVLAWAWRPPLVPRTDAPVPSSARVAGSRPAATARLYFVAVGVSKYARKEYELGLAAKDAGDFAALMKRQVGLQYASVHSRLLTDADATRSEVLAALDWLRQSVGPGDTGMLFIAGHGVNDGSGRYYFMPQDADVDNLARTSVNEGHLRTALAGIKGRAVLFVDTCFAGKVVGRGAALNNEVSRLVNSLAAAENGVIVFSSSTGRQPSIEQAKWGNGAFTKALIEGLQGGADFRKEGVVTHQGLSYYLGQEVMKITMGRQTPVTAVPLGVVDYPMVRVALR